jgi:DivIVA domain-containing protein
VNLFLVLIVVLLIGLTAAAVLGKISGFLAEATTSRSFGGLSAGPLSIQDVEQLHFDQGLRGYRMEEVDEVLDALCTRVRELEAEVASLQAKGAASLPAGDSDDGTSAPRG